MSNFVKHLPCPNCQSKDNLGLWDDGHKFCFGCGYYEESTIDVAARLEKLQQQQKEKDHDYISLPSDTVHALPKIAVDWLDKFGLSRKEKSAFCWSDQYESLIYSVFDSFGDLLMFQSRYMGTNKEHPRYYTSGIPGQVFNIIGNNNNCIVVVEEIISAIKVGRHTSAMPLWGSNISSQRITRLANMFPNIIVWLDNDKKNYAIMARQRAQPFFNRARCIISEFDPKAYTDDCIKEFLNG